MSSSPPSPNYYEVEITANVVATSYVEALKAVSRSGINDSELIGETMILSVTVYDRADDDE